MKMRIESSARILSDVKKIYWDTGRNVRDRLADFRKEISRRQNDKVLQRWNRYIDKELGIDNLKHFELVNRVSTNN